MATSKGELMKLVYGENYTNIDAAIPIGLWDKINTRIHVVNYNGSSGTLENIVKVGMSKGIQIPDDILIKELKECQDSEEYFYNNYCREEGEPWYTPDEYARYQIRVATQRALKPKDIFHEQGC